MAIPQGTHCGHYKVLTLLGSGGMGYVYLAEDTRLGRKAAIKILPVSFTCDKERLRRFEQEAKSASSLNHPNILTIYEIGQTDATHFIATEFVDGLTLRQRLQKTRLKLIETLDVATQLASALAAAHQAGIVHRDIKPENVMIRADGLVKVLDFGLVKLIEQNASTINTQAPTLSEAMNTDPGLVMGTVRYMSPEQARGLCVDSRTDVWSLGVVLYEMIAGRPPFDGATKSDVFAAVLMEEPAPLHEYAPETSAQLQRVVRKALTKEVEERYQDIRDFRIDLKTLKREFELEAGKYISAPSPRNDSVAHNSSGAGNIGPTKETTPQATSSIEYLINRTRQHKRAAVILPFVLAVALTGVAYALYKLSVKSPPEPSIRITKATRLTSDGRAKHAAISPDGNYVAYVREEAGQQSLMIRQVATESAGVLVPPSNAQYSGLTFSHRGSHIFYVVTVEGDPWGSLYRVSAPLPDTVKKLLPGVRSPVSISFDDEHLAFVREDIARGESSLVVANIDGTAERVIASRRRPEYFAAEGPAWSPDGSLVACSAITYKPGYHEDLVGVRVADGSETKITSDTWANIGWAAWLGDGSGLVVVGRIGLQRQSGQTVSGDPQHQDHLWYLTYPGGRAQRVTSELNKYYDVSLTAESSQLVSVQAVSDISLWLISAAGRVGSFESRTSFTTGAKPARQLTRGLFKYDGVDGLALAPDGRIFYVSYESAGRDIWSIAQDGSGQKNLTDSAGSNRSPAVSPDGRYIVFASTRAGERNIWRMNIDGSGLTQLTDGKLESDPCVSPDGQWVVYSSIHGNSDKQLLWRVSINGGAAQQLTDKFSARPAISPDGKLIAYLERENSNSPLRQVVVPFEGGTPVKTYEAPLTRGAFQQPVVRWSPDGRMLTYVDTREGISNIWGQPLAGGEPVRLTAFEDGEIFWFDWSRDGGQLVVSRGRETSDVVLLSFAK
ncbi:MAG: protein kinase [Pyrinomonadaceae bacterium]